MEMDIYMRRRLVALAVIVGIFILFVLLIRSCGGDDDTAPLTPVGGNEGPQPLSQAEHIAQADAICAEVNSSIDRIDPADEDANLQELELTQSALQRIQALNPAETPQPLNRFLNAMNQLVTALDNRQTAIDRGDTVAQAEAETQVAAAREKAQRNASRYGFTECGEFGSPGTDVTETGDDADTGGAVAPPPESTAPPPAETAPPEQTAPPPDDGSGGVTPDSGGLSP